MRRIFETGFSTIGPYLYLRFGPCSAQTPPDAPQESHRRTARMAIAGSKDRGDEFTRLAIENHERMVQMLAVVVAAFLICMGALIDGVLEPTHRALGSQLRTSLGRNPHHVEQGISLKSVRVDLVFVTGGYLKNASLQ